MKRPYSCLQKKLTMKQTHQLLKLRIETIQDLKRLMTKTGQGTLDGLIAKMICLTDAHRRGLKETGWDFQPKRDHR
jgi:hypothetical protein